MKPFGNFTLPQHDPEAWVRRESFDALLERLARKGAVNIPAARAAMETHEGLFFDAGRAVTRQHPFKLSPTAGGVVVSPGYVVWPGAPGPVPPKIAGRPLSEGPGTVYGSGLLCVLFNMAPEVGSRTFTSVSPSIEQGDFTGGAITDGEPHIDFVTGGEEATADLLAVESGLGTLAVPVGFVGADGIWQFVFQSFAVWVQGLNFNVRFL